MTNLRAITRNSIIKIRSNITEQYQQSESKIICNKIRSLNEYRYAKRIALYYPNKREVNLQRLFNSAPLQGKKCYFPVMNEHGTLSFMPAHLKTKFVKNKYDIMEPEGSLDNAINPDELNIIFLPLVAFDSFGNRLGMGAGYYDQTLKQCKNPLLIGVAYEFQKQPYIEPQDWDLKLNMVITNKGIQRSQL